MPNGDPEARPIVKIQAERLAKVAGLKAEELAGKTVRAVAEEFKWRIDPELLLFRRVCGRVVQKDATGAYRPVPYATVHVEDTDCGMLGYFPSEWFWGWFFPFFCRREEIGTATADACGRFCVYIPRWEIDWILRWRRERICPEIFIKPSIREIIDGLRPIPEPRPPEPVEWPPRPPRPQPDPPPFRLEPGPLVRRAEELVGRSVARRLLAAPSARQPLGLSAINMEAAREEFLDAPRFTEPLAPPIPGELGKLRPAEVREHLAERLQIDRDIIKELDLGRFIGPFWRCRDVLVPEWEPFFDVPDITFRVTQDVDGDGTEEIIYSESYFDVRWNTTTIPDVTLEASAIAIPGVACDTPAIPCVDVEVINRAGLMPLENLPAPADPYHDSASGYARRPNRPHPSGTFGEASTQLATAPFLNSVQLYGCNHRTGATYYRIMYRLNGGPRVAFTGLSWPLYRFVGGFQVRWVTPDPNGWYEIIPDAENWEPSHLLLEWPTGAAGLHEIDMEFADAGKNPVGSATATVGIRVDNSTPLTQIAVAWRRLGMGAFQPLGSFCPVVSRPPGTTLEFQVAMTVSAGHLRSVALRGGGCGGDRPSMTSPVPALWEPVMEGGTLVGMRHWHTNQADNAAALTATYRLPPSAPQGVYSFSLYADSRGFNPSGGDGGFAADWNYNSPAYRYANPVFTFAVVNV